MLSKKLQKMKTWIIKIKVLNEKSAIEHLELLIKELKSSVVLNENFNNFTVEDSSTKEKLVCRYKKRVFNFLKKHI